MDTKRIQVNVRLTDEEGAILDRVSNQLNLSKSEIVRHALNDNLEKAMTQKVMMTPEDRERITRIISELLNELNAMTGEINRVGNNINQIAKVLHSENKKTVLRPDDREDFEREFIEMSKDFNEMKREVMELWRSLV